MTSAPSPPSPAPPRTPGAGCHFLFSAVVPPGTAEGQRNTLKGKASRAIDRSANNTGPAHLLGYHGRMAMRGYIWALFFLQPATMLRSEVIYEGLPEGPALIQEDRRGRIYVAVLGPHGAVLRHDERGTGLWKQGNVGGLDVTPDGDLWLVHGNRILRYAGDQEGVGQPVDRTPSFRPRTTPGRLFASRWGDLWASQCGAMRRPDALFAPAPWARWRAGIWSPPATIRLGTYGRLPRSRVGRGRTWRFEDRIRLTGGSV